VFLLSLRPIAHETQPSSDKMSLTGIKMESKKNINNQSGFGLIQVIVSMGLLGVLTLFTIMQTDIVSKIQKKSNDSLELSSLSGKLNSVFNVESNCTFSLSQFKNQIYETLQTGQSMDLPLGSSFYIVNSQGEPIKIISQGDELRGKMKVNKIELQKVSDSIVKFNFSFLRPSKSFGGRTIAKVFEAPIEYDVSDKTLSCLGANSQAPSFSPQALCISMGGNYDETTQDCKLSGLTPESLCSKIGGNFNQETQACETASQNSATQLKEICEAMSGTFDSSTKECSIGNDSPSLQEVCQSLGGTFNSESMACDVSPSSPVCKEGEVKVFKGSLGREICESWDDIKNDKIIKTTKFNAASLETIYIPNYAASETNIPEYAGCSSGKLITGVTFSPDPLVKGAQMPLSIECAQVLAQSKEEKHFAIYDHNYKVKSSISTNEANNFQCPAGHAVSGIYNFMKDGKRGTSFRCSKLKAHDKSLWSQRNFSSNSVEINAGVKLLLNSGACLTQPLLTGFITNQGLGLEYQLICSSIEIE